MKSNTFWPVAVSVALMLILLILPTGYEGALSYQNADRVPALVLSADESDVYDTGLVRTGDQRCRVRILKGQFAGVETDAVNRLSGSLAQDKLFRKGDAAYVVVSHSGGGLFHAIASDTACAECKAVHAPSKSCSRVAVVHSENYISHNLSATLRLPLSFLQIPLPPLDRGRKRRLLVL